MYTQVYKGLWKGSVVAIKTIVLPAVMSGQEKREKMAIMEAAISSALSHPNIMQVGGVRVLGLWFSRVVAGVLCQC